MARNQGLRLGYIEIDGIRVERRTLPEQFGAYCVICGWMGPWRSIWDTWDQLLIDIKDDLQEHLAEVHV